MPEIHSCSFVKKSCIVLNLVRALYHVMSLAAAYALSVVIPGQVCVFRVTCFVYF